MKESRLETIRRLARPLERIPTGEPPRLWRLPGIRAVLFDIYGTLFVSQSGDLGAAAAGKEAAAAFAAALDACGLEGPVDGELGVQCLHEAIAGEHERMRKRGVEHPEVRIEEIWRALLPEYLKKVGLGGAATRVDGERAALEYEMRINPVWPMPGARECLGELQAAGVVLGLVSNAQAFTRDLFPALLGGTPEALGFDRELEFYSYALGEAKPGEGLHRLAAAALSRRGIEPGRALYVGNDVVNDLRPARAAGLRTALFAGDARSLRLRRGDPRAAGVEPDVVVTDLRDLLRCLAAPREKE